MRKLFPFPGTSIVVFLAWLIFAGTYSVASFFFAAALGILMPFIMRALEATPVRLNRPLALLKLMGIVLIDIVRSNIAVCAIILGLRRRQSSGFLHVPLEIKNPCALSILGIIITSTPGTLWVQYDSRSGILVLHILDLVDHEEWIRLIQNRYEALLKEVFE